MDKYKMSSPVIKCNICEKILSTATNLNTHVVLTHTEDGIKHLQCTHCPKKFVRRADLNRHTKSHQTKKDNPLKCKFCSMTFILEEPFQRHQKLHESNQFNCNYCKYSSARKDGVDIHQKIHIDVKPFQCDGCPKGFRRKQELVIHIRFHTGEKPFQCKMCPKKFTQSCHRLTHTKLIH